MTVIFVGAGRSAGIRPGDLVGAITGEAHLPSKHLGKIQIAPHHSLVEVPESLVERVIRALRGTSLPLTHTHSQPRRRWRCYRTRTTPLRPPRSCEGSSPVSRSPAGHSVTSTCEVFRVSENTRDAASRPEPLLQAPALDPPRLVTLRTDPTVLPPLAKTTSRASARRPSRPCRPCAPCSEIGARPRPRTTATAAAVPVSALVSRPGHRSAPETRQMRRARPAASGRG